jgi:glycosyltransferase involved in cell wall biosynthesis
VTLVGRYAQAELPALMREIDWVVVPSVWWENSPLVIQEAFANGRPVLCSDIGGMAEKVADGVSGLHFRVGDPHALAQTMERAAATDGLWDTLAKGIPPVYGIRDAAQAMARLYRELLGSGDAGHSGARQGAAAAANAPQAVPLRPVRNADGS